MPPAVRLLTNGYIYTVDPAETVAEALAIGPSGEILFVGAHADAVSFCSQDTRVTDLDGRFVLPGFVENHTHADAAALKYTGLYLGEVKTVPDYLHAIRSFAQSKDAADLPLVVGGGWEQAIFQEYNRQAYDFADNNHLGPSRFLLDEALRGTPLANVPVKLSSSDLHCAWYNSAAIELARGKSFDVNEVLTENQGSDVITRVPENAFGTYHGADFSLFCGQPWGVFREAAVRYVDASLPTLSPALKQKQAETAMQRFIQQMYAYGVTALQDILITPLAENPHVDVVYKTLKSGRNRLLWRTALWGDVWNPEQTVQEFRQVRQRYEETPEFEFHSVKLFADATLKGMYLLEPFADAPADSGNIGSLHQNVSSKKFNECIAMLHREHIPVHIHAMGDRAVKKCLDALEEACAKYGEKPFLHHTLTHLLLAQPEDIRRMARLKIIASLNSYWHYQEPFYYEDFFLPLLGPARASAAFPARRFWEEDVLTCLASDGIVSEKPSPLWGVEIAVTRNAPGAADARLLHNPIERLSRRQAIAQCTINGAHALGLEAITGSLEVGKRADLVILEQNILSLPANEIHKATILETVVCGQTCYADDAWITKHKGEFYHDGTY
nr:amidohydrolase family protein [uncultured Anaeromusa sp.]